MRESWFIIVLIIIALASALYVIQNANRGAAAEPQTAVVADEQAGIVRIIIEGREAARFDAAGLHVRENIDYGGMLTDYGHSGFDERAGWKEYERLKAGESYAP